MTYSVTLMDLLYRPIIRNNFDSEWKNKMTDDEIKQIEFDLDVKESIKSHDPLDIAEYLSTVLSKTIDRDVMYNLLKESKPIFREQKIDQIINNMANFYGQGRSNYVEVTDVEKFKELCDERNLEFWESAREEGRVGCGSMNEDGDYPIYVINDQDEEVELPDFLDEVSKILKDEEVFIWMCNGNEKLRYLSGSAVAVNNKGDKKSINIDDIYDLAKDLGKNVTMAQY